MSRCERLRPQLSRVAEGEANPVEAMRVARHLPDCTACRIQLARERRLAAMLEEELSDPLFVGEDFVRAVMAHLPSESPRALRRRRRGILRLAGIGGLLVLAPALAPRGLPSLGRGPLAGLAGADLDAAERLAQVAASAARMIPIALDALSAAVPTIRVASGFAGLAAAGAFLLTAALLAAATVVAAATTGLLSRR
jgi:predicted anti-sigma-YlaC factor YlaD